MHGQPAIRATSSVASRRCFGRFEARQGAFRKGVFFIGRYRRAHCGSAPTPSCCLADTLANPRSVLADSCCENQSIQPAHPPPGSRSTGRSDRRIGRWLEQSGCRPKVAKPTVPGRSREVSETAAKGVFGELNRPSRRALQRKRSYHFHLRWGGTSWEDDRMHMRMASHRRVSGRSLA